jgi:hypothetical protein
MSKTEEQKGQELRLESDATLWKKKIAAANSYYEEWEGRYDCKYLEECFEGFQWKEEKEHNSRLGEYRAYVVNLFYSSIETKVPNLLFNTPIFNISPRPAFDAAFNLEMEFEKARLREDVLNSFSLDDRNRVAEVFEEIAYNSFFRFGAIEVGYGADWIDNPKAGLPIHEYDTNEELKVTLPAKLPENERIFIRSISPRRFRVFGSSNRDLTQCDGVGYYEWFLQEELEANKNLKNLDKLQERLRQSTPNHDSLDPEKRGLQKVWFIWDNRKKVRRMIHDGSGYELKSTKFDRLPIFMYAPIPQMTKECAYPVPLAFNWVSPQMELNEVRETARVHRRKFKRKYLIRDGAFTGADGDNGEQSLIDLIHGGDGAFAFVQNDPNTVAATLPTAPMDPAARDAMITSKDDFNIVSATSADQRGEADRVTATQATQIFQSSQVRENHSRAKYAKYLCKVAREVLMQHSEKLVNPFWIQRQAPQELLLTQASPTEAVWEEIVSDELDGENFDVQISITSLSPMANEEEKKKLFELMTVLKEFPALAASPMMLTEVMDRIGYRNMKVRGELQNMAYLQMLGVTQMMDQSSTMSQGNMEKMTPDTQAKTENQLKQLGSVQ